MKPELPFFNFSLKKVMELEQDAFRQARIKILVTILIFSQLKILVLIPVAIIHAQYLQVFRGAIIFMLCLGLIKYLLYKPAYARLVAHAALIIGLLLIWSNLLVFIQDINLVTIQFVFMVTLCGFYLIGRRLAMLYAVLAILPVILFLLTKNADNRPFDFAPQELASPGFEIIVFLNFVTTVLTHYLFYQAFRKNLQEKETLNLQLQASVADAKALAESRSVFLSTMSHELRTPLNAVIGMTNLIKDSSIAEQKEDIEILEFSAHSLLALINDILDYNKSENDKIELEAIPVNLFALMYKACSGLELQASEKGLQLKMDVDKRLDYQLVYTDPTRITQIIYNLAGNAIKFTRQGHIDIKMEVLKQDDEHIQIFCSVSDTGIGIAAERQQAIFDPFTQASADTTRNYGGTGLGLAIVKRLLKLFGSTIHLKSKMGAGSEFSFSLALPLYHGELTPATLRSKENTNLKSMKVLIAEDNRINALLLEKLLSRLEVYTTVAVNGKEAVEKLLAESFDVILMDLHMPVMDGYEAALQIRALSDQVKAAIPIIALTASVSHDIYPKIIEVGMQDYLSKPFQPAHLFEKLQRLYSGYHASTPNTARQTDVNYNQQALGTSASV